jgi:hypothetical protein
MFCKSGCRKPDTRTLRPSTKRNGRQRKHSERAEAYALIDETAEKKTARRLFQTYLDVQSKSTVTPWATLCSSGTDADAIRLAISTLEDNDT